jgi:hypothetical protein
MATIDDARALRFPSKIDWWIAGVLVGGTAIPLGLILLSQPHNVVALPILGGGLAFSIWLLTSTYYVVMPDALLIRSGPISRRVAATSLRSLEATRNPLSSPALSLDRIEVRYDGGRALISPRDREGFVRAVLAAAPQVSVAGLPYATTDRPGASGTSGNTRTVVSIAVAAQVVAVILVGVLLYAGTRPPEVTLAPGGITIRAGMYSRRIADGQITGLSLESSLPPAHKRRGFNAGAYLRGRFEVDGLGRTDLFVIRGKPPYLFVHTNPLDGQSPLVIVNYADPSDTRALYDELQARMR